MKRLILPFCIKWILDKFHTKWKFTRQGNAKYTILLQMFRLTVPNLDMHAQIQINEYPPDSELHRSIYKGKDYQQEKR